MSSSTFGEIPTSSSTSGTTTRHGASPRTTPICASSSTTPDFSISRSVGSNRGRWRASAPRGNAHHTTRRVGRAKKRTSASLPCLAGDGTALYKSGSFVRCSLVDFSGSEKSVDRGAFPNESGRVHRECVDRGKHHPRGDGGHVFASLP